MAMLTPATILLYSQGSFGTMEGQAGPEKRAMEAASPSGPRSPERSPAPARGRSDCSPTGIEATKVWKGPMPELALETTVRTLLCAGFLLSWLAVLFSG